jgi:hypothetical protein
MAWHASEYKRYLKSNAWAIRKSAYYRRHNRQCFACGSLKRIQLHHVTYDSLGHEPIRTCSPLSCPPCQSPTGLFRPSGSALGSVPCGALGD